MYVLDNNEHYQEIERQEPSQLEEVCQTNVESVLSYQQKQHRDVMKLDLGCVTSLDMDSDCQQLFMCPICGKAFTLSADLQHHIKQGDCHAETQKDDLADLVADSPHACEKIFNDSDSDSDVQPHFETHSDEHPYQCHECNETFKTQSTLQSHRLVHSNVKQYMCIICNKSFLQKQDLSCHIRLHTGNRRSKSFTQRSALSQHMTYLHRGGKHIKQVIQTSLVNLVALSGHALINRQ